MLTDITIGQYFEGKSLLHRLDPRLKIIVSTLMLVFIFIASKAFSIVFLIAVTVLLTVISGIPVKTFGKTIKMLSFILIISFIFIAFGNSSDYTHRLFTVDVFGWFKLSMFSEGLEKAIITNLRIISLIMITGLVLTYTTSPIELTDGIERVLKPLTLIHIPVHDFAMIMSIALRFIPTLLEETDKIMNAQKARGADFSSGGLIKRVKSLLPVFIPLLISSFRRALELATAMECRCYHGGEGRTRMKQLKMKAHDYAFLAAVLVFCAVILLLNNLTPSATEIIYSLI